MKTICYEYCFLSKAVLSDFLQVFIVVLRSMGVRIWAAWGYNASMAQCDHSTGTEDTAACIHVCVAYIREG